LVARNNNDDGIRPLEDIFGNTVARILDFLIVNEPFDYSLLEISQIARIPANTLQKAISLLVDKGLVEQRENKGDTRSFALNAESELSRSLRQYVLTKINYDIEREKTSRRTKGKVSTPRIRGN
jgi:DNA-binding transcriptional regulator GbsR (MarR family)